MDTPQFPEKDDSKSVQENVNKNDIKIEKLELLVNGSPKECDNFSKFAFFSEAAAEKLANSEVDSKQSEESKKANSQSSISTVRFEDFMYIQIQDDTCRSLKDKANNKIYKNEGIVSSPSGNRKKLEQMRIAVYAYYENENLKHYEENLKSPCSKPNIQENNKRAYCFDYVDIDVKNPNENEAKIRKEIKEIYTKLNKSEAEREVFFKYHLNKNKRNIMKSW